MTPGKLASQTGHAFLEAYRQAPQQVQAAYHVEGIGTKVSLACPNLTALLRYYHRAREAGIPAALIEDTGHNTCFHGVPTITTVGIGPATHAQASFLRSLPLVP